MKNKKIILLLALAITIVIMILVTWLVFFSKPNTEKNDQNNNDTNQNEVPKVEKYTAGTYTRIDNPTAYQKEIFDELKNVIEDETFSDQALAEAISKNFIAEFYNLSNVSSKDVRGTQFVPTELVDRFKKFGADIYNYYQYYKNIKDLEVGNIEVANTKSITYNYKDDMGQIQPKSSLKGYEITVDWSYKDKTNYSTKITIVKWNDQYSVVKVTN